VCPDHRSVGTSYFDLGQENEVGLDISGFEIVDALQNAAAPAKAVDSIRAAKGEPEAN
jgi:hypothetical protein